MNCIVLGELMRKQTEISQTRLFYFWTELTLDSYHDDPISPSSKHIETSQRMILSEKILAIDHIMKKYTEENIKDRR